MMCPVGPEIAGALHQNRNRNSKFFAKLRQRKSSRATFQTPPTTPPSPESTRVPAAQFSQLSRISEEGPQFHEDNNEEHVSAEQTAPGDDALPPTGIDEHQPLHDAGSNIDDSEHYVDDNDENHPLQEHRPHFSNNSAENDPPEEISLHSQDSDQFSHENDENVLPEEVSLDGEDDELSFHDHDENQLPQQVFPHGGESIPFFESDREHYAPTEIPPYFTDQGPHDYILPTLNRPNPDHVLRIVHIDEPSDYTLPPTVSEPEQWHSTNPEADPEAESETNPEPSPDPEQFAISPYNPTRGSVNFLEVLHAQQMNSQISIPATSSGDDFAYVSTHASRTPSPSIYSRRITQMTETDGPLPHYFNAAPNIAASETPRGASSPFSPRLERDTSLFINREIAENAAVAETLLQKRSMLDLGSETSHIDDDDHVLVPMDSNDDQINRRVHSNDDQSSIDTISILVDDDAIPQTQHTTFAPSNDRTTEWVANTSVPELSSLSRAQRRLISQSEQTSGIRALEPARNEHINPSHTVGLSPYDQQNEELRDECTDECLEITTTLNELREARSPVSAPPLVIFPFLCTLAGKAFQTFSLASIAFRHHDPIHLSPAERRIAHTAVHFVNNWLKHRRLKQFGTAALAGHESGRAGPQLVPATLLSPPSPASSPPKRGLLHKIGGMLHIRKRKASSDGEEVGSPHKTSKQEAKQDKGKGKASPHRADLAQRPRDVRDDPFLGLSDDEQRQWLLRDVTRARIVYTDAGLATAHEVIQWIQAAKYRMSMLDSSTYAAALDPEAKYVGLSKNADGRWALLLVD